MFNYSHCCSRSLKTPLVGNNTHTAKSRKSQTSLHKSKASGLVGWLGLSRLCCYAINKSQ